jgi:hypothetical protein
MSYIERDLYRTSIRAKLGHASYDPEQLRRELFERSAITRAAHALELAADQLREAPGQSSWAKCSVEIHSAAMTAMHGALGALELSGEYRLAVVLEAGMFEEL